MPRNIVFTATAGQSSVRWGNSPTTPTLPSLELESPDAGTVDTAISGGRVINNGASSALFILSSTPSATITPSSGTVPAGGSVDYTFTPSTAIEHTITLTNVSGGATTGSPALFTPDAAAPSVGTTVATLKAYASTTGTSLPFSATVLPLEGDVPDGYTLESPDDATLKASILSRHSDDSAAVIVVSGHTNGTAGSTATIRLQTVTEGSSTALTASDISALLTNITVSFGSYGTTVLTDFSTPTKTWWANSRTICARYVIDPPSPGSTALQAVVDVHAYNGRAFVEVVIENGKMTTASPTKPAAATYTGATVSINGGAAIATVDASAMPTEGEHTAFRAWYASGWVGGDPGLRVTQLHTEIQAHPLLWECDQTSTFAMSTYAADAYTPWSTGRQRASNMGGGGDHASIGPLPQWEAHALQGGDYRAWKAVEASALAVLGYNVNYRDSTTGLVPTITALAGKTQQSNWPRQSNGSEVMTWEVAHHPAAGLMAFISRPSPVFIELAQKVAVFNATLTTFEDVGPGTTTGVFGQYYQMRGRAWGIRSLAHATFLTPDALPWKAAGVTSLGANATYLDAWRTDSKALLNCFWDETAAGTLQDADGVAAGFQSKVWQHHYLTTELHKAASAGLLTGSAQTTLDTIADWAALQPVRWINEQTDGAWKFVPYHTTIGRNATTIDSAADWATQMAWSMTDSPTGTVWKTDYSGNTRTTYATFDTTDSGGTGYPGYLWSALVAAVERGVAGAATAWETVQDGISNLSTWRAAFATDPRHGSTPRSGIAPAWVAGISTTQWTELSGAPIFSTAITALAGGGFLGSNPITAIVDAYAEPAFDEVGGKLYFHGGGHLNGSNNGVYCLDLSTLAYSTTITATPPAKYPPSYTAPNSNIVYPSGATNNTFQTTATLTDPADTPYAAPYAGKHPAHEYGSAVFDNGIITYHYGTSVADADVSTGLWSYLIPYNPYPAQLLSLGLAFNGTEGLQEGTAGIVDPVSGEHLVTLCSGSIGDNARYKLARINASTKTVVGSYNVDCNGCTQLILVGTDLYVLTPSINYGSSPYIATMNYGRRIDLTTGTVTALTVTGGPVFQYLASWTMETTPGFSNGADIYLWNYGEALDRLYRATPSGTTLAFSAVSLTASSIPMPEYRYKLHYMAAWGVVVTVPNGSSKPWALRV